VDPSELSRALEVGRDAAKDAGALIFGAFRGQIDIRKKGEIDLVTEWDLKSEALIRQRITDAFPDHRIVGEEGEEQGEGELTWYVDPIDGTTNFSHGHPFFCVSIGLYRGTEGLLGVIVAPALGLEWWGARGLGAFCGEAPCRVSEVEMLKEALVATGFPYDRWTNPDNNLPEYHAFLTRCRGVRRCGSAALDLALTADGTYSLFWEQRLSPWDLAAGCFLVTESGGQVSDYDGGPLDIRTGRAIATNGALHQAALKVLQSARADRAPV
jgi:myo-inositol-1(or 4)-monophosphatase